MPFPAGLILIWSGAIVDIPPGYVLCDGNNGTPNLILRFVRGAGGPAPPGGTGGGNVHTHPFTGDGHTHDLVPGSDINAGTNWDETTNSNNATGTTDDGDNVPPFYTLAYIMKT